MTKPTTPAGTLSPMKRFAGLCALLAVIVASISLGYFLSHRDSAAAAAPPAAGVVVPPIVLFVFGVVVLVLGTALYGLVLLTHCFTFRFDGLVFAALKPKLWIANLMTGLLLQAGFAFMVGAQLQPLAASLLSPAVALPASFFAPFIVAQFILIWFQIWGPLELSIIRHRLKAQGITNDQLSAGIPAGISDPTKNSFKKLSQVEDDIGMLWIDPARLVYRGDSQAFDVAPGELERVERKADAGSTSSYFGAVHVILHVRPTTAGAPYAVRLHAEGEWTMTGKARDLRVLADRLETWGAAAAPGEPTTAATAAAAAMSS